MILDNLFDIQRFAEGGDGGAAGTSGAADGALAAAPREDTGVTTSVAGKHGRSRANPLANVRYGTQPQETAPAQQAATANETAEDTQQETFEDLIKGRYKQDFDSRVQQIVQARLKNSKDAEGQLNSLMPALELLSKKYNLEPGDDGKLNMDALIKTISDDTSLYEEAAMKRGVSPEVEREIQALERTNAQYRQQDEMRARETALQTHFRGLAQQAEQLKGVYPGFDLQTEMRNPEFARLTSPGVNVPVRTAYELVHKDELIQGAVQYATRQTAQAVATSVQQNARRPDENGLANANPVASKTDPKQLKKADFREIRKRIRAGERITFD